MGADTETDMRCKGCGVLLGKRDGRRFNVERNGMKVQYRGTGQVRVRCYNPYCGLWNSFDLPDEPATAV